MYGDFIKSREEGESHHQAPSEPLTAKKRHVLGRSHVRMEPLKMNQMLPELTQLLNTAKKERRSHEPSLNRCKDQEWVHSNNTIPETLNSSKERNISISMENLDSHIPGVALLEATPVKSFPVNQFYGFASSNMDKENFFTPQKASEPPASSTPAQSRHPLAALPLGHVPSKESQDQPDQPDEHQSTHKQVDSLHSHPSQGAEKNSFGSLKKPYTPHYDSQGFRTPHCKMSTADQSSFPTSVSRQRLYGTSTSRILALQSNVPLHPVVAAGQQQAKQQQQQSVPFSARSTEAAQLHKVSKLTPFKAVPPSATRPGAPSFEPVNEKVSSTRFQQAQPRDGFVSEEDAENQLPCGSAAQNNHPSSFGSVPLQEPKRLESLEKPAPDKQLPPQTGVINNPSSETSAKAIKTVVREEVEAPVPSNKAEGAIAPQNPLAGDSRKIVSAPNAGHIVVNGKNYIILSLLGRGGSSKVYQVLDPVSSQLKAVKCVNLSETDESICQGYLNEIKLLADLQGGDCVIQMFDHAHQEQNRMLFVVMEKGDTDLSKLIKDVSKSKKISAPMIVYYWTEMLNAVSFIHKHGIIHSDLKPANFLLVSGRLKLIDFGIASSVQEDMTSVVKDCMTGTYNYISPESLSNTSSDGYQYKISYKSDVWSLGCILYNLVYGRTPFQHISGQFQKMNAIVSSSYKIPFPDPPIEGCPSALAHAMKICLVRNPKDRPSVDELLQLPYLDQTSPERGILSQVASLVASVGLLKENEDNRAAAVVRSIQRLLMENERHLPSLRNLNVKPVDST